MQPTGKNLGKGADATVQEVNWLGTLCAAKQLHEILLEDDSAGGARCFIENFEKECMTWSRLVHPCIVQFLGVYFLSGLRVPMLILEKMDTSLRYYLEAHKKEEFPLPDKVYILRQVAQALSYLHNLSPPLVHHDLSPNNVLLNAISLQAKVTDFGMTRALEPSKMTRKSSIKGTQAFMAPEALVEPPKYDEKLDVFSYGNVIVTTVTHQWPNPGPYTEYEGDKLVGVSELHRRQQYIDQFSQEEGALLLPTVCSCLENRPYERPTSIQLVDQMRQIEASHPREVQSGEATMAQLREQLCKNESQLHECRTRLQEKDAQLQQRDQILRLQHDELELKDTQLQQYQTQLQEKDDQLKQKDDQLKWKDEYSGREFALLLQENQQIRQERDYLKLKRDQLKLEQDKPKKNKFRHKQDQSICERDQSKCTEDQISPRHQRSSPDPIQPIRAQARHQKTPTELSSASKQVSVNTLYIDA